MLNLAKPNNMFLLSENSKISYKTVKRNLGTSVSTRTAPVPHQCASVFGAVPRAHACVRISKLHFNHSF